MIRSQPLRLSEAQMKFQCGALLAFKPQMARFRRMSRAISVSRLRRSRIRRVVRPAAGGQGRCGQAGARRARGVSARRAERELFPAMARRRAYSAQGQTGPLRAGTAGTCEPRRYGTCPTSQPAETSAASTMAGSRLARRSILGGGPASPCKTTSPHRPGSQSRPPQAPCVHATASPTRGPIANSTTSGERAPPLTATATRETSVQAST